MVWASGRFGVVHSDCATVLDWCSVMEMWSSEMEIFEASELVNPQKPIIFHSEYSP